MRAGRVMVEQVKTLSRDKADFGFETTLSGVTYTTLLRKLKTEGYRIQLFFLWIPTVEMALARIENRVRRGGHNIPEKVVRRRFHKGLKNLFTLYRPLLDTWELFDNSETTPVTVAREEFGKLTVLDEDLYGKIRRIFGQ